MPEYEKLSCRFTLSPMSDRFVEIILGAIEKVDTHLIRAETGKLSTVYRGEKSSVEDGVKACFVHAYRPEVHMTMEATYFTGWPGEEELDWPEAGEEPAPNAAGVRDIHFPAVAKATLYPLGAEGAEPGTLLGRLAREMGVYDSEEPDCVILSGDIHGIFDFVERANRRCGEIMGRYALAVTFSVNSPTA